MKNKTLYIIWGCLFILCAVLGFIPEPTGFLRFLLVFFSVVFFAPGAILLYLDHRDGSRTAVRIVRTLSLVSLCFTLIFLVLNLLSGNAPNAAGDLLYGFLVIFSTPMICSQYWIVSLFLWACLLMTSISILHKDKKR